MKTLFIKRAKILSFCGVLALLCMNVSMYCDLQKYREIGHALTGEEKPAEYFYQKYHEINKDYNDKFKSEHAKMCLGIAAHMGLDDAQAWLGYFLQTPYRDEQTEKHGLQWVKKAAEQGKAKHQFSYASCIGFPIGEWERLTPNEKARRETGCKAAFSLYRKAAEQGHVGAMKKLAQWYQYGYGGVKNLEEALRWAKKAYEIEREEGDNHVAYRIGEIYMEMGRPDLAEPYLELRAIYGDPRATNLWYKAKQMLDQQKKSIEQSQR